jgi:cytoplasmic iron level regulating protein YaaA (DUF328/UPF0246 family)
VPASVAVLLPPSEAKQAGGSGTWSPADGAFGALAPYRRDVAAALAVAMADDATAARLTGVAGELRRRARQANTTTVGAPVLPASRRYRGVVWEHLDGDGLRGRARTRAAEAVVVVSALGGLYAWDDPVPDYKCKLGASLGPLGPLARFWRAPVTEVLARRLAGATVWDLLPAEHARAVDLDAVDARRVVRVEFVTATGRAAGHGAKAVKGRFARHLLDTGAGWGRARPDPAVATFAWEGWTASLDGDVVTVALR